MAGRPGTARSEISSAISDDGRPDTGHRTDQPSLPNPSSSQHGFSHLRGVTQPTNRSIRGPPPPPSSTAASSRPQSPAVSTTSRTHVPSLTAQGFFRPMSSQKLQAQRFRRPTGGSQSVQPPTAIPDEYEDEPDDQSVASSRVAMPKGHRPFQSITTDYTHSEEPELYENASHEYASHQEGETGLVDGSRKAVNRPTHLNISAAQGVTDTSQKSPLSFRSGLSLASKSRREPGHQHLSSNATSPRHPPKRDAIPRDPAMGKNHEYFEGNTIFWWGGRVQNARDRPINIATGIFLVVPAICFFAGS